MVKDEVHALTGLRGVAAMLIVAHHFGLLALPLRTTIAGPALEKCGLLGMSIFFVLSGFVIHYNYASKVASGRRGIMDFAVARFARLYPLYLLFVLGNFAYTIHVLPSYAKFLPYNILGIQSWIYHIQDGVNITLSQFYANNAWSISAEIIFYLAFVPIAFFGRFGTASMSRGVALLLIGIVGRFLIVHYDSQIGGLLAARFGETPVLDAQGWLVYFSPYGRLFEFLAGTGLGELWLAGKTNRLAVKIGGLIGMAYIVASFLDKSILDAPRIFEGDHLYIGYAVAVPLFIFWICHHRSMLTNTFALAIGEASYSIYLLHSDLFPLYRLGPESTITQRCVNLVSFLCVLGLASWASHRYIEMPAKRFILSRYRRRPSNLTVSQKMNF